MPFQKIVKLATDAVKQVAGATASPSGKEKIAALQRGQSATGSAPRGRGMAGIPAAVISAVQQGRGASSPEAERKKKIADAVRKAAGAVARPLTLKKGGMAKKSTVKAKARKK